MEAKPCPFCGNANVIVIEASTFRWRQAACESCGATGPEVRHDTLSNNQTRAELESASNAIAFWNERK